MEGMSTYSIRIRDTLKYVLEDSELAGSFNPYGPIRNGTFFAPVTVPPADLCLSVSFEASKHDSRSAICTSLSTAAVPRQPNMREPSWPCSLTSSSCFCLRFPIIQHLATNRARRGEEDEEDACMACFLQSTDHRVISNWILQEYEMPSRKYWAGHYDF